MESTFGARLRAQRERQQVPLSAIAEQTKIKLSMLEGLERDDLGHWPKGIFRRAYLRAYARAIGLDAETTLREFLEIYPDPIDESAAISAAAENAGADGAGPGGRPPTRLRYLVGSALGSLHGLRAQLAQRTGISFDTTPAPARNSERTSERAAPLRAAEVEALAPEVFLPTAEVEFASAAPMELAAANDSAVEQAEHVEQQELFELERAQAPQPVLVDLASLADLCTRLARAVGPRELAAAMRDAADVLRAAGLIVWIRDPQGSALWPLLSHGYSAEVIAQLPSVNPETDNAIASAFRSVETRVVDGSESATGAVVVPLVTPNGCGGVLALEFKDGGERHAHVRAFSSIIAAQLSTLVAAPSVAEAAVAG